MRRHADREAVTPLVAMLTWAALLMLKTCMRSCEMQVCGVLTLAPSHYYCTHACALTSLLSKMTWVMVLQCYRASDHGLSDPHQSRHQRAAPAIRLYRE